MSEVNSAFLADAREAPTIINNYSNPDVKHALDDSLRRILVEDYGFVEDHSHTDRKLILGYLACLFAAASTLYSHFVPFPDCRLVLIVSVAAYFVLNGAMLAYGMRIEKDVIFVGANPKKQSVVVTSKNKRFSPEYSVSITFFNSSGSTGKEKSATKKPKSLSLTKNIGSWFDIDGELAASVFYKDITGLLKADALKLQ